jgi:multiple sugar transport system substrate-binding protein
VLLAKGPRGDLAQKWQKEFEELTGITVGSEQVPEQQQRQKSVIEFTSGSTSFDVIETSWHVQKRLMAKGKWLHDLRDWLKDPTMTPADYDSADFSKASMSYAIQADGRQDTLPLVIDYWILYCNKELFAAKGLKFPKTLDEMLEAAKAINDPAKGIYGYVGRGLKNANTPVWNSFMLGWDVDTVDDKGVMYTDGPEAIAAAQVYQKLMKDYAPPGVAGFNWNEAQTSFIQGTAGMWFDGIGFADVGEDKTKSKVAGKIEYALQPAGPKKQHSGMFGTGVGISTFSKKKEAAYFYCLHNTSKQMQSRLLTAGAGAPARNSAYNDPDALKSLAVPQAWVDTLVNCGPIGRPGLPVIIPVTEFRDVFGIALTNMISGADPATELKKATEQFKPILEKSEKG